MKYLATLRGPALTALLGLLAFTAPAWSQSTAAADAEATALQGTWVVTAAEQGGKPFDAIKGGKLKIEGSAFDLVTAKGTHLTGTLSVNPATQPRQLDFLLAGGEKWLAIYSTGGRTLRLNYVEAAEGDPRPTEFATSNGQPGTIIALRREEP